jgi:hypothetical protein
MVRACIATLLLIALGSPALAQPAPGNVPAGLHGLYAVRRLTGKKDAECFVGGIRSESCKYAELFSLGSDEHSPIASGPTDVEYADFLWACATATPTLGPTLAARSQVEQDRIHRLFVLYASLYSFRTGTSYGTPEDHGDWRLTQAYCADKTIDPLGTYSGPLQQTDLGQLLYAAAYQDAPTKYTDAVTQLLTRWQTKRDPQADAVFADSLVILYLLAHYPDALGLHAAPITFAAFASPSDLFVSKTTPSLLANLDLVAITPALSWKELGMASYWSYGYTPASAWFARRNYANPTLSHLVPFYGQVLSATEEATAAIAGTDQDGIPVDQAWSATKVPVHLLLALGDYTLIRALAAGSWNQLTKIAESVRTAGTVDDAVTGLNNLSNALTQVVADDGTQVGNAVALADTVLGTPVPLGKSLVMRALGYTEAGSGALIREMEPAILAAGEQARTLQASGKTLGVSDFYSVLDNIASALGRVGAEVNPGTAGFGEYRLYLGKENATLIVRGGKYEKVAAPLEDFAKQGMYLDFGDKKGAMWINQLYGTTSDGTKVPLTAIVWYDRPPAGQPDLIATVDHWAPWFAVDSVEAAERFVIPAVEKEVSMLFWKAIDPKLTTEEESIDCAAKIMWWLDNAPLFRRGTNVGTDALTKTIHLLRGEKPGQWAVDKSPDFATFTTASPEDFAAKYRTLFERAPAAPAPVITPPPPDLPLPWSADQLPPLPGPPEAIRSMLGTASLATGVISGWAAFEDSIDEELDVDPKQFHGGAPAFVELDTVNDATGKETVYGTYATDQPSPSNMDQSLIDLGKDQSGFSITVPSDVTHRHYRVYATHAFLDLRKLLYEHLVTLADYQPCGGVSIPLNLVADGPDPGHPGMMSTVPFGAYVGVGVGFVMFQLDRLYCSFDGTQVNWTLSVEFDYPDPVPPTERYINWRTYFGFATSDPSQGFPQSLTFTLQPAGTSLTGGLVGPDGTIFGLPPGSTVTVHVPDGP